MKYAYLIDRSHVGRNPEEQEFVVADLLRLHRKGKELIGPAR